MAPNFKSTSCQNQRRIRQPVRAQASRQSAGDRERLKIDHRHPIHIRASHAGVNSSRMGKVAQLSVATSSSDVVSTTLTASSARLPTHTSRPAMWLPCAPVPIAFSIAPPFRCSRRAASARLPPSRRRAHHPANTRSGAAGGTAPGGSAGPYSTHSACLLNEQVDDSAP